MEKDDQRNLILALVLCFGLFMLYNMFVLEPQQKAAEQQRAVAAENRQEQVVSNTPAIRPRAEIVQAELAANQRVVIDAPAIDGSKRFTVKKSAGRPTSSPPPVAPRLRAPATVAACNSAVAGSGASMPRSPPPARSPYSRARASFNRSI